MYEYTYEVVLNIAGFGLEAFNEAEARAKIKNIFTEHHNIILKDEEIRIVGEQEIHIGHA